MPLRAPWWSRLGLSVRTSPGHGRQPLVEFEVLLFIKGAVTPVIMGAYEAAAIGDQAVHGVADSGMAMATVIDAIVLSPASHVKN
jgi:hypothetical protein